MVDIPINIRERVIALSQHTSKSNREIARDVRISEKAVRNILKLFNETGSTLSRRSQCGRKRKLTKREEDSIIRESKKNPRLSSSQLKKACGYVGEMVSTSTIRKILLKGGRKAYRPLKRPKLTPRHRQKRQEWARSHYTLDMDFWNTVSVFCCKVI
jgi:transposase